MPEEPAVVSRLPADQKGRALGRETVSALAFGEQSEAGQRIHDRGQTTNRRAAQSGDLLHGLRAGLQMIEDAVASRRLNDQRGSVAPRELHDSFGCDGGSALWCAHTRILLFSELKWNNLFGAFGPKPFV